MTRKQRDIVTKARKINRSIPRNGTKKMDDRAFALLSEQVCLANQSLFARLAKK